MGAPKGHPPYPGCETGGKPKKYTQEFIENEAEALKKWIQDPENVYFKRFALSRGYHPNRMGEFAKVNENFSEAYELSQAWQEIRLTEGGLTNDLNWGFCKFVLSSKFGWVEKNETKLSGDAANPLTAVLNFIDGKTKDLINDSDES